jgi:hypothetical protein
MPQLFHVEQLVMADTIRPQLCFDGKSQNCSTWNNFEAWNHPAARRPAALRSYNFL